MEFFLVEALGITCDLVPLRTTSQPFTIHFYQHQGVFAAANNHIGNENDASAQFTYFFNQARSKNSDLVLTPEYSCPWKNILEIVNDEQLWPAPGKLWALGCESILKKDLAKFKTTCAKKQIFLNWETEDETNNKTFYDPLVYLFRGLYEGVEKLIILVQDKTHGCAIISFRTRSLDRGLYYMGFKESR